MSVIFHCFYFTLIFSCRIVKLILTVVSCPFLLFGFQLYLSVRNSPLLGTVCDIAIFYKEPLKLARHIHILINFLFSSVQGSVTANPSQPSSLPFGPRVVAAPHHIPSTLFHGLVTGGQWGIGGVFIR